MAEVTEDSLGTYTCMPYNALGSMGWSPPAPLVLKVLLQSPWINLSSSRVYTYLFCLLTPVQDPPKFSVVPGGEYRQEAGRELVIPCEAEGDPFPNITWRKVRHLPHSTAPLPTWVIWLPYFLCEAVLCHIQCFPWRNLHF